MSVHEWLLHVVVPSSALTVWGNDGHSVLVLELDAVIITVELDGCHDGDVELAQTNHRALTRESVKKRCSFVQLFIAFCAVSEVICKITTCKYCETEPR